MTTSLPVTDSTAELELNGWHRNHRTGSIAGSIYAVAPGTRSLAARAARGRMLGAADIIIDSVGAHYGVTVAELSQIRRECVTAKLDVHIMVLGDSRPPAALEAARAALLVLLSLTPQRLTVAAALIPALFAEVYAVRSEGAALWLQVDPSDPASVIPDREIAVDGVLVMLVAPGSTASANFDGLAAVTRFERMLPVGVDGGVTSVVADSARSLGAEYIVSGRALFFSPHESHPLQRED